MNILRTEQIFYEIKKFLNCASDDSFSELWFCRQPLNLRINTHKNDFWSTDSLPCDKHFQMSGHNFNAHAKFTIIEEVYNKSLSMLELRRLLEHREDFWILKSFPARSKHIT